MKVSKLSTVAVLVSVFGIVAGALGDPPSSVPPCGPSVCSLAPSAPAAPNPIPEKPQELSIDCGRRAFQNCMYQLWLTPTSQQMMPLDGMTAWQSATTRSGRIGVAWAAKFGWTNSSQAARHCAISASQCRRAAPSALN